MKIKSANSFVSLELGLPVPRLPKNAHLQTKTTFLSRPGNLLNQYWEIFILCCKRNINYSLLYLQVNCLLLWFVLILVLVTCITNTSIPQELRHVFRTS